MLKKEYLTVFIIMVTEVLGFSIILPFLPFYAQEFGANPLQIGLIFTVFSLFQFISAPVMGRLSDHYGRKPLLIFSQLSTFISFIVLGFSNSLWMIYLSRIIDGMLGSNFTIAQAYLSDISSKKDRSKAFGLGGAAFGFGFLIGPAAGGYLSRYGYGVPSFVAAGFSLLTILMTLLFLKETITQKTPVRLDLSLFQFGSFRKFFANPNVGPYLWIFFSYVITHSLFVSTFALYAERQLGFNASNVGFLLTYIGVVSIILRGVLLGKLIDIFGEKRLQYAGVIMIFLGMVIVVFADLWLFIAAMTMFAVGTGLSRPVLIGAVSRNVDEKEQGSVLGVTGSLVSLAQIVGPLVGGFLINYFFAGSLGIGGAILMLVGLILTINQDRKNINTHRA